LKLKYFSIKKGLKMKFKNTFILMILLSQTSSLWGMEDNQYQEKVVQIKKKIEEIKNNIKVDENSKRLFRLTGWEKCFFATEVIWKKAV
jgi:hypothetical protein